MSAFGSFANENASQSLVLVNYNEFYKYTTWEEVVIQKNIDLNIQDGSITIQKDGNYILSCFISFEGGSEQVEFSIFKNGWRIHRLTGECSPDMGYHTISIYGIEPLENGDELDLRVARKVNPGEQQVIRIRNGTLTAQRIVEIN